MPLDPDLDFTISVREDPDCTVVVVGGELDVATTPDMEAGIASAAERGLPVVLDASGVTFMDSTGLAGLLSVRSDGVSDLTFVLRQPSHAVRRILELTGLTGLFEIDDSPGGAS